jgi:cell division septum initiation protein DivIVA
MNEPGSSAYSSSNPPNPSDKLSTAATDAKARVADLGRRAAETIDHARTSAADGLSTAADAVHHAASEGNKRATRIAHATADGLSGSANYLRDHSASDILDDAMNIVKNNPGLALLGAAALGFVVGRAFSSRG